MTDHLLISLEFSLFFILYFFIRWSVNDRSPIDFARILFLYSLLGGLSTTDHLLISLEFYFFILYLFLFLPYTFLSTRLLEIDIVNFLQISVSHQALWFQV